MNSDQMASIRRNRSRIRWQWWRWENTLCRHLLKKYLDYTLGVGWGKDHRPFSLHSPKPVAVEAVVKIMFCIAVSNTNLLCSRVLLYFATRFKPSHGLSLKRFLLAPVEQVT
ncbi:hypothetical protein Bca101_043734 [Brassica carinata]